MRKFKTNYKLNYFFLFFTLISILLSACKKHKIATDDNTVVEVPTGEVRLHLHTYIFQDEIDAYGVQYLDSFGRAISIDLGQFYISDIQLEKLDGTRINVDSPVLKVQEAESISIGKVPVGNYKKIHFKIGLNSTLNALVPNQTKDSLLFSRPEMWFSNPLKVNEYVFFNLQGHIDTSKDFSGKMAAFSYKIGTNQHLVAVELPDKNFSVTKDVVTYYHTIVDYSLIFNGIDVSDVNNLSVTSILENNNAITTTVTQNIGKAFRYE